jgi:hypothetical protein
MLDSAVPKQMGKKLAKSAAQRKAVEHTRKLFGTSERQAWISGRRIRILAVVDDFTRECLALVVDLCQAHVSLVSSTPSSRLEVRHCG